MGNVCCVTEEAFNDAKVKEVIDGEERGKLLNKNGHNNDTIPSVSSQNYVSSTNQASSDHDPDTLLEAFEESCVNKDFDNAMALMEEYSHVDFLNHEFSNGDKALHYAIREKNSKFAYFILQKGADPNATSRLTGDTALHIATKNEDVRMITLLMKWKASLDVTNGNDKTPHDIAIDKENDDIIDMFDATFQTFLTAKSPTIKDYSAKVKSDVLKNKGSKKNIKSAWQIDDGGQSEIKARKPDGKKQRTMWKPSEDAKTNENETKTEPIATTQPAELSRKASGSITVNDIDRIFDRKKTNEMSVIEDSRTVVGDISDEEMGAPQTPKPRKKRKKSKSKSKMMELGLETIGDNDDILSSNNATTDDDGGIVESKATMTDMTDFEYDSDSLSVSSVSHHHHGGKKKKAILDTMNKVAEDKANLPKLGSWMEKRRSKAPHTYQKRFVCVIDGHLLWNEKKIKITPNARMDNTERKKFSGSVSLMMVKNVGVHESKKKNTWKFQIILRENAKVVKGKKVKSNKNDRVYLWKCYSRETRDMWVDGLTKHIKHLKRTLKHIENI